MRSGGSTGATVFWPNGYAFRLDGSALTLTGDSASVSTLDESYGGAYWGTMRSDVVTLSAGTHTFDVSAASTWGVLDFIEVTQLNP